MAAIAAIAAIAKEKHGQRLPSIVGSPAGGRGGNEGHGGGGAAAALDLRRLSGDTPSVELSDLLRLGLIFVLVPLGITFLAAARLRFRPARRRRLPWDEVSPLVLEIAGPTGVELAGLGFELVGPVEVAGSEAFVEAERQVFQCVNAATGTWAYLGVALSMDRAVPVYLELESFTRGADGREVALASEPARAASALSRSKRLEVMVESTTDDVRALYAAHVLAVEKRCGADGALALEPDAALSIGAECASTWLEEGRASGKLVADGDLLRFSGLAALRTAFWFRYQSGAHAAHTANARLGTAEVPPHPSLEARRYRQLEDVVGRRLSGSLAGVLFVLGALLFLIWFGLSDPMFGAALFGTVLVHEAGHALAMRAFGYRDPRIYFLPGLGGATVGHKRDASIHVEAIVLLAGPVPGIALGVALTFAATQLPSSALPLVPVLSTTALVLVTVNTLNLIPALPFDGGRLAHRIVGGLHPAIDLLFRVASIAMVLAMALALGDVLFGTLAILLAIQTPTAFAAARAEHDLRREGAAGWPEHERIEAAFRMLSQRGWARRYLAVKQIDLRLAAPDASALSRTLWASAYGAIVLGAVFFGSVALWMWFAQEP